MVRSSSVLFAGLFLACLAMNIGLSTQEEQWVLNKDHQSDFEVSGSKVTFKHQPVGYNYFNAMYLGLNANDKPKAYWEFDCSKKCTVGLAKRESFADGFGIKGAFFNGNLMDGSSLLLHEFGTNPDGQNKVGFILEKDEKQLKVYIVQNGRPLGLAYTQDAPFAKAIHPVVMFPRPGTVEIKENPVTGVETLLTRQDFQNKEAQGSYKLVKAEINGEVKSLPEFRIYVGKNAVNPIAKTEGHIDLAAQATNNLGGVIKKTGSDANGDVYQLDNVSSTLVGTFGKDAENENVFFAVLKSLNRVQFSPDYEELTIKNSQGGSLQFKRFVPVKPAQKTNELSA